MYDPYIALHVHRLASRVHGICEFSLSESVEICIDLPNRHANGLHPTFYFSAHWGRLGCSDPEAGISCVAAEAWNHACRILEL